MKRLLSLILACLMLLSLLPASAEEAVSTDWDLTLIYADEAAFQADYEACEALIPGYEKFRGTLTTPQAIHDALIFSNFGEIGLLLYKMELYVNAGLTLDPADPYFNELEARVSDLSRRDTSAASFIEAELMAIPLEERVKIFADPVFDDMSAAVTTYTNPAMEPLSEEASQVLETVKAPLWDNQAVYNLLYFVECPYPEMTLPDGSVVELRGAAFREITGSPDYSREVKTEAEELYYTSTKDTTHTYAALLEGQKLAHLAEARLHGFDSAFAYRMAMDEVEPAVYNLIIDAVHGSDALKRYFSLCKEFLGVDQVHLFDNDQFLSEYAPGEIPLEEAVEQMRGALAVLGDEYLACFNGLLHSGMTDIYPKENKSPESMTYYTQDLPLVFVTTNYTGTSQDVSTLIHEMGHACYNMFTVTGQPSWYQPITQYTHETAAVTNEILYYTYMIDQASEPGEKAWYLNQLLHSVMYDLVFGQAVLAEFEEELCVELENGGYLNADSLGERFLQLYSEYSGPDKYVPDSYRYYWAEIPHLYENHYVYQYATAALYASSIARALRAGEEGAAEKYLAFLKAGGSADPAALLSIAGVDVLNPETYAEAMRWYEGLVDELEGLLRQLREE